MTDASLFRAHHARDVQSLHELNSLLHDETCDVDEIVYSPDEHTLLLPCRRQFHEGPEVVIGVQDGTTTYEKHWMRTEVLIRGVRGWEKLEDPDIGSYDFNTWEYKKGLLEIFFCQSLVLAISVDVLDVSLTDLRFEGRARIGRGPFGREYSTSEIF